MINQSFLPVFERDQVLSHKQLNALVTYLEEQDRLTRNKLIGMGVVCGLKPSTSDDQVELGCGTAVTSAGYLAHLDGKRVFKFYAPYQDPTLYEPFRENGAQIALWELLEDEPDDDRPWRTLDLLLDKQRYCVVLFLELLERDLDSCIGDHCTNQGKQNEMTWRALLVEKDDLQRLTARQWNVPPGQLDVVVNGRYLARPMSLERARFRPSMVQTFRDVKQRYADICNNWTGEFTTNLGLSLQAFRRVLMHACDLPDPITIRANLYKALGHVRDTLLPRVMKDDNPGIQVIYDYMFQVTSAHNSFIDLAFEVQSVCCGNPDLFPRHVPVGCAVPGDHCKPHVCRQELIPSSLLCCETEKVAELRRRYLRLAAMIEHGFRLDVTPDAPEIRITPGGLLSGPLGERAVPYYFHYDTIKNHWHHHQLLRCRHNPPSYHATDPTPAEALRMRWDDRSFLRIEGVKNRSIDLVESELNDLIVKNNLSIDVVTVRLGDWRPNDHNAPCDYEDLRSNYRVAREEWVCLNRELTAFLNRLGKKSDKPGGIIDHGADEPIQYTIDYTKFELYEMDLGAIEDPTGGGGGTDPTRKTRLNVDPRSLGSPSPGFILGPDGKKLSSLELNRFNLGGVEMVFPIVPANIYPTLPPRERANTLISTLIGKLLELIQKLDEDLLTLDYEALKTLNDEVTDKIETLIATMQEIIDDKEKELTGNEHLLVTRLANWLDACSLRGIHRIVQDYRDRGRSRNEKETLAAFLAHHPGLEHKSGACPGETFVLVTMKRTVFSAPDNVFEEFADLLTVDISFDQSETMTLLVEDMPFTSVDQKKIDAAFGRDAAVARRAYTVIDKNPALKNYYERLRLFGREEEVVVLDFTLPYLCCGDGCRQVSYVVLPELKLSLERSQFCGDDEREYPFTMAPEGGSVEGAGVARKDLNGDGKADTWVFTPADAFTGPNLFTYRYGDRQAVFRAQVFAPPDARFTATQLPDSTEVRFESANRPDTTYTWTLPDGTRLQGPVVNHVFRITQKTTYDVTLLAKTAHCKKERTQEVVVTPLVDPPSISLPKTEFCKRDPGSYLITVAPVGGELSGPFKGDATSGFRFLPSKVNPGDHQFTYTMPDSTAASVTVTVHHPTSAFSLKYNHRSANVVFTNKSTGANQYVMALGDGREESGFVNEHRYSLNQTEYVSSLTAIQGECRHTSEQLVHFPEVAIRLGDSDAVVFSAEDMKSYRLALQPPSGGVVEGPVVTKGVRRSRTYYFKPDKAGVSPGMVKAVTFTRWYHGRSAALKLHVYGPPAPTFTHEITLEDSGKVRRVHLKADFNDDFTPPFWRWQAMGGGEFWNGSDREMTIDVTNPALSAIDVILNIIWGPTDTKSPAKTIPLPPASTEIDFPIGSKNPFLDISLSMRQLRGIRLFDQINQITDGALVTLYEQVLDWLAGLASAGKARDTILPFLDGGEDLSIQKTTKELVPRVRAIFLNQAVSEDPAQQMIWTFISTQLEALLVLLTYRLTDLATPEQHWDKISNIMRTEINTIQKNWSPVLDNRLMERFTHPHLLAKPQCNAWATALKRALGINESSNP
ncbi:MAG: hypothetical protein QNK37_24160 [Acidobacteriota bacterium]|nr:hypothetical protein [Acidobacteriota bacterium]